MAGRVLETGDSHVETRCAHVMGLPIVPLQSYLVIDESTGASVELADVHGASLFAAFGRSWGAALTGASIFALWLGVGSLGLNAALAVVGLAGLFLGWRTGRLDAEDLRRYARYAPHTGHALDPVLLPERARIDLRDALSEAVIDAAVVYAGAGYREAGSSPHDAWEQIALRPEVRDTAFLERALALARLEASLADDEATRRRFDDAHEALWRKLDDVSESSASGDDATAPHVRPTQPTRRR